MFLVPAALVAITKNFFFKYVFIKLPFKIMENCCHETTLFTFNPITLLYNCRHQFHSPPGFSTGICNGHDDVFQVCVLLFFIEYYFVSVVP